MLVLLVVAGSAHISNAIVTGIHTSYVQDEYMRAKNGKSSSGMCECPNGDSGVGGHRLI